MLYGEKIKKERIREILHVDKYEVKNDFYWFRKKQEESIRLSRIKWCVRNVDNEFKGILQNTYYN